MEALMNDFLAFVFLAVFFLGSFGFMVLIQRLKVD